MQEWGDVMRKDLGLLGAGTHFGTSYPKELRSILISVEVESYLNGCKTAFRLTGGRRLGKWICDITLGHPIEEWGWTWEGERETEDGGWASYVKGLKKRKGQRMHAKDIWKRTWYVSVYMHMRKASTPKQPDVKSGGMEKISVIWLSMDTGCTEKTFLKWLWLSMYSVISIQGVIQNTRHRTGPCSEELTIRYSMKGNNSGRRGGDLARLDGGNNAVGQYRNVIRP